MNYCIFFISCHISTSVESIFKHFHILNEFNERRFLSENHGRTHTFIVSLPCVAYILTRNENDATTDVWGVVHTTNACEYLAMMTNGLPQFIILYGSQSKIFVHHTSQNQGSHRQRKSFPYQIPLSCFQFYELYFPCLTLILSQK